MSVVAFAMSCPVSRTLLFGAGAGRANSFWKFQSRLGVDLGLVVPFERYRPRCRVRARGLETKRRREDAQKEEEGRGN